MNKTQLAKYMHEQYENVAKDKNWNTQESCKVEFEDLPKENREVMLEVADRVILKLKHEIIDTVREW